jgi:hypothetical protein
MKIGSVVSFPQDVEIMVKTIAWSDLGYNYEGMTEALIFKTKISDYSNADAKAVIENKLPSENSVRMGYVKIQLALNEVHPDYKEQKAVYDKYINQIANKAVVQKQGYFWAVTEAKIQKEGSMVLSGSNDITPILYSNSSKSEPFDDTPEPPKSTQKFVDITQVQSIIQEFSIK